jgi:hypothetical protein
MMAILAGAHSDGGGGKGGGGKGTKGGGGGQVELCGDWSKGNCSRGS